jgi:anti-sigma B factor antagonist
LAKYMIFSLEKQNEIVTILLHPKRVTAEIAREFKDALFQIIDDENQKNIVIDLSAVEFMDSFFLGAIVSGLKKCRNQNGDIYLAQMPRSLRPLFELMNLDEVFKIFPTREEALQNFLKS